MQLTPIDLDGLRALKADWDRWFVHDPALFEHARPYLEHTYRVCAGQHADARVAIYQFLDEDGIISSEASSAEALTKLVYDEATGELCAVWNAWHPKYETNPPPLGTSGYLTASFIEQAISLAATRLHAHSLRIYLQNLVDPDWAAVFAALPENKPNGGGTDTLAIVDRWLRVPDVNASVTLPKFDCVRPVKH